MRCLTCQYDLRKLTPGNSGTPGQSGGGGGGGNPGGGAGGGVHRCPECGRIFDANDPQTFASGPMPMGWPGTLAVCIVVAVSVSLLVMWLVRLLR